jgi:hypothetical protein
VITIILLEPTYNMIVMILLVVMIVIMVILL